MRFLLTILCVASLFVSHANSVEFSSAEISGAPVTVCRVKLKEERLQLFLRNEAGRPLNSFDGVNQWLSTRGQKLAFAMNAGMFHPGFAPVGLFVNAGAELTPLNFSAGAGNFFLKPNGVFAVTPAGACVIESSQYPKSAPHALLATQSGPLLVLKGKIHPAFKPGSTFRLFRNGVGVPSPDVALFAITEGPVNLYDFAVFFRDVLHCPNALFLDGTLSSLYAPSLHRNDKRADLGPIIGITQPVSVSP